jgi:hypothetical protein
MRLEMVLRLDEGVVGVGEIAEGGARPVAVIRSDVDDAARGEAEAFEQREKSVDAELGLPDGIDFGEAVPELVESGLDEIFHAVLGKWNAEIVKVCMCG